jgi:hypothetical protein
MAIAAHRYSLCRPQFFSGRRGGKEAVSLRRPSPPDDAAPDYFDGKDAQKVARYRELPAANYNKSKDLFSSC